ncbi:ArsR family transcriptional regulator [Sporolactobacillus shoreae]|uniref:ArsR family transcriptional regulator n=1 Tax=Sporolactobacillus shoreae TaxID=1465501 RepID=A0A4Z0GIM5_9BACL|nr:metalloregulator ArsR/SmtB family transcription factor [Sporolactobacillus shoreae]TGA96602.1 ArsR family transcriptional regulator [Sporolactobacillus shoreae]
MTLEKNDSAGSYPNVVTDHFQSIVVEIISSLSLSSKQREDPKTIQQAVKGDWSAKSAAFFMDWYHESPFDLWNLLNFLLPCPYFHDVEKFVAQMRALPNPDFVYHFFGEEISLEDAPSLIKNTSSYINSHEHYLWDTENKRAFFEKFILQLNKYRESFAQIILEIAHSRSFHTQLDAAQKILSRAMNDVRSMAMGPLNLAQFVMGKNFRRISDYKLYNFIPCYFIGTRRLRVFSKDVCIVIYGCASPLTDRQKQSRDLEKQLKALADHNRLTLLSHLSHQELYGARLAEYLGLTTATVSHHLEVLRKAGFVIEKKSGTIKYFCVNHEALDSFMKKLKLFTEES